MTDPCDQCMESDKEIARVDENGKTVCVDCDAAPVEVEYRKVIVLSTAHLMLCTRKLAEEAVDLQVKRILFPWTYGYMCYAYQEQTALGVGQLPEDIWQCCKWVNENAERAEGEHVYIHFDRDGPVIPDLIDYENWEEMPPERKFRTFELSEEAVYRFRCECADSVEAEEIWLDTEQVGFQEVRGREVTEVDDDPDAHTIEADGSSTGNG